VEADHQGGGKGDAGGGSAGLRAVIGTQKFDDAEKWRFGMWNDGILPLSGKPRWEKRVMGRGGSVDLEGRGIVDNDSSVLSMALCAHCLGAGHYDFSLFHFPVHIRDGQPAGSGSGVGGSRSCRRIPDVHPPAAGKILS
jgi:hypothetical protein